MLQPLPCRIWASVAAERGRNPFIRAQRLPSPLCRPCEPSGLLARVSRVSRVASTNRRDSGSGCTAAHRLQAVGGGHLARSTECARGPIEIVHRRDHHVGGRVGGWMGGTAVNGAVCSSMPSAVTAIVVGSGSGSRWRSARKWVTIVRSLL